MSNFKDISKLNVFRQNDFAGTLTRTKAGCAFQYSPSFVANPKFQGISYAMPKTRSVYKLDGANLHPFFAGLLPEGLRLKSLVTNLKTSRDDMFSLFAAAGSHTVGDVHAVSDATTLPVKRDLKLKQINFFEFFDDLVHSNSYAQGEDSLAGVQEKISASMISFPLNIAARTKSYILKLNPKDKPNLVENELHCMKLARRCGLNVARVKIVIDRDGNRGLLVERFDRHDGTSLHQEDFCQILDRYPADKYRISINEIAEGIRVHGSAPQVTTLRLLEIHCFSYLIGNGDLHAKNLSLVESPMGLIDLSPAYDLLTTLVYGDTKMALKLDGKDDNLKRKSILDFAVRMGLKRRSVEIMLDRLLSKFARGFGALSEIPMLEKKFVHLEKVMLKRFKDLT